VEFPPPLPFGNRLDMEQGKGPSIDHCMNSEEDRAVSATDNWNGMVR